MDNLWLFPGKEYTHFVFINGMDDAFLSILSENIKIRLMNQQCPVMEPILFTIVVNLKLK